MLNEWTIERSAPEQVLTAGNTYQLKNLYHDRYVVHGNRDYGINLVWRDESFRDVFFRNPGSQGQPIKYDEPIAIAIADGGYLRYEKRDWGINLRWSDDPVYEWKLTGGQSGDEIAYAGNMFGIYNTESDDHVVYCQRGWGINLKWVRDCSRFDPPKNTATCSILWRTPLDFDPGFGAVKFQGQLQSGNGSEGETAFDRDVDWESLGGTAFGLASTQIGELRIGLWKISAFTPRWSASCLIDLAAGTNESINFEEFSNTCGRGFGWPRRFDSSKLRAGVFVGLGDMVLDADLQSRPESKY